MDLSQETMSTPEIQIQAMQAIRRTLFHIQYSSLISVEYQNLLKFSNKLFPKKTAFFLSF